MIGRIIPYSQVFVSLTLDLEEASVLSDVLGSLLEQQDEDKKKLVRELLLALDSNLEKAAAYQTRKAKDP